MPRGRPRKPKLFPGFETAANDKGTAGKDNEASVTNQIAKGKSRGRPRQPRPEVLNPKEEPGDDEDENEQPTQEQQDAHELPIGRKRKGRQKDEKKSNLNCEFCGKFFKFRATLKQHEQIHYGIKEFECEICYRRFLHKGTLKVHLRLHTGEMPYKCPHCPKQFRGQTALDCHVFRHTKQGTKCPQCSSVFATPSIVKQHIREVHTTERLNTCQICGVTYKHLKSLRLHLRNHQKRICPDCGKVFHSVYVMMTHRKIHAQDHFKFKCAFCDRKFEKEDELESHNKLRGRTYQCEMCCHSFNKPDYLENHNRRNHWKELGLEQLKVAPPKNGWNRKGVPKPKKKETEEEENVPLEEQTAEPIEVGYNVDVPSGPETWHNYNVPLSEIGGYSMHGVPPNVPITVEAISNSEDIIARADQNVLIEILEAPSDGQPARILKTITTEIEPVLPYRESNFKLGESVQIESIQDEPRLESDHDYAGDDHCQDNDDDDDEVADDALGVESQESEMRIKVESDPEIDGSRLSDTHNVFEPFLVEKAEESPEMSARNEPDSDSDDDEKPLAALLPKLRLKRNDSFLKKEEIPSKSPPRCIEKEPLSIKTELEECSNEGSRTEPSDVDEKPMKSRKRKQEIFCSFCGDSFKWRSALKKHKKTVHPDIKWKEGPFICEVCGKTYATSTSLVCHRSRHEEYQRFKCDECPKAFTFRCYLETHKRAEHLRERLICSLCGKQFKYSQDLKVHTRQHEDDKPFKCDQCPSEFRYPSALRSHKACHEKTVFSCDICNKAFKYANSLRVHKRLHSGIKRFRCEICEREFNTKAPLVRHLATHSVEREMKCVVCDKIFYKKVDLVIHQSKEHPNNPAIGKTVKIHTCDVCGQEFAKKSNMKAHAYIHGDVYKYKCRLCKDQQFKQHAGLRHHLIHFHKMNLSRRSAKSVCERKAGATVTKDREEISTVDATLTPAVSVIHNGIEFLVQQVDCE
ncbi:zinc finger protein 62 homolog [Ochlerotatus camptorhynchus]|uniref:zinc finger protein 62 homolog n=1 Tax=Ochlerotatus camptorhynchus TaxID=644619 RepID=UPI0031D7E92E